ncbi:hypothetical protein PRIPAC_91928 [Pristionchus pacificus]|uniref:Ankyrin repeat-containing protein n=1 Tax=Pristionchus pacificus TaxID=54126 RepID=A0A2A6BQU4_PRIPA|nr:hypothetical protein PRIPAC_91928 [Pristionchus pacificus]|eukprot:PDM68289.1 Ankyrin repeat-containing protein [Pristionchus pacificus]
MRVEEVRERFPLHFAVWNRDLEGLVTILNDRTDVQIDSVDPRGRTPLMLAVTMDQEEIAKELLKRGANADAQNKDMWSVSHEAIATGNGLLAKEVIMHRDYQRSLRVAADMKQHLDKLKESPDFYAEMSWEFASWVPFVSKLCPSDTYKIWKRGSSVRIDTTLVGFEGHSWQRGSQSFIFRLEDEVNPQLILIDHEAGSATIQSLVADETLGYFEPTEDATFLRMTSPISTTYIDIEKIGFERSKGGILSWIGASEKKEKVAGYDCKVFNASNVELVTKTRSEHLSEADRARFKQDENSNPLSSILNMVRTETGGVEGTAEHVGEPDLIEYFDEEATMKRDIGRQRNVMRKSNSFKATLWLAEQYPLCLQEQVAPIVNLMSSSSAHFSRLNTFMRMQLPAGFPVKIEIPLFHVVSAKITFGRINEPGQFVTPLPAGATVPSGADSTDGVPLLAADGASPAVEIDPRVFDIPDGYRTLDDRSSSMLWWPDEGGSDGGATTGAPARRGASRYSAQQQEDMLLQLAIEQSLLENAAPSGGRRDEVEGCPVVPPSLSRMRIRCWSWRLGEHQGGPSTSSALDDIPDLAPSPEASPSWARRDLTAGEYLRVAEREGWEEERDRRPVRSVHEEEMELALKMSLEAAEEDEKRRRERRERGVSPEEDDDEVMRRILELSMTEK